MAGPVPQRLAYLDHAAATPMRPAVREAMLPWLGERFGNPSGSHAVARAARTAIDEARDVVAEALGCAPNDVVFTGGGTEADNLAILGVAAARPGPVVISAVEHHAVLHPAAHVGGELVAVDRRGVLDLDALAATLEARPDTTLVSVMTANNEVGAVQPVAEVVRLARKLAPEAAVHTDAVQAAVWLDVAEHAAGADLVSITAHKFGGPQGVGVLAVRRGTPLRPHHLGGGQERDLRSGTHNVAGIVGLAAAVEAKAAARDDEARRVGALRDRLADELLAAIPDAWETAVASAGDRSHLLPNIAHLSIDGVESEALLFLLDEAGVCASAASACASGAQETSHVLGAMGALSSGSGAVGALRLSLGWTSTDADVDQVLDVLPAAVARLRHSASSTSPRSVSGGSRTGATHEQQNGPSAGSHGAGTGLDAHEVVP